MAHQLNLEPVCSKHKCTMTLEMGGFYICHMCESEGRNIKTEVRQFNIVSPDKPMTDIEREEFWNKLKETIELLNGSVI